MPRQECTLHDEVSKDLNDTIMFCKSNTQSTFYSPAKIFQIMKFIITLIEFPFYVLYFSACFDFDSFAIAQNDFLAHKYVSSSTLLIIGNELIFWNGLPYYIPLQCCFRVSVHLDMTNLSPELNMVHFL